MSERKIQTEILLAASGEGLTLWRQNVGTGWAGKSHRLDDGSVLIRDARPLHAGLCKGSSDLIGLRQVTITEEMVGQTLAQFVALEVKQPGKYPTPDQRNFLDFVRDAGGLAKVVRGVEDLK